jgi:hypothetical protein
MPWMKFEPTIPVFELTKTVHALDRGGQFDRLEDAWQSGNIVVFIRNISTRWGWLSALRFGRFIDGQRCFCTDFIGGGMYLKGGVLSSLISGRAGNKGAILSNYQWSKTPKVIGHSTPMSKRLLWPRTADYTGHLPSAGTSSCTEFFHFKSLLAMSTRTGKKG